MMPIRVEQGFHLRRYYSIIFIRQSAKGITEELPRIGLRRRHESFEHRFVAAGRQGGG